MMKTNSIEIDFDIHKMIEADRRSFDETPNVVLRRLLGLSEIREAVTKLEQSGRSWSSNGVELPHGTLLRATYNGRIHEGHIIDGIWRIENKDFKSPSGALKGVALTKKGTPPSVDGWAYWEVLFPETTEWVKINKLLKHSKS